MNGDPSTPYSRDLGDELRQVRERYTTFRSRRIARMLGWDPGKVSNIEHGKVRATEIDIIQYLGRYRSAFDHYFVQVPTNLRTVTMAESSADKITTYNLTAIPGLVQAEEYATAYFEVGGVVSPEDIKTFVRLKVGSDEVMEDQLMRLLFHTHVIRIVPASIGPAGIFDAPYVLWEYEKRSSVAYTESDLAMVFVQDLAGVKMCKSIFARLDALALDEEQSRSMVADLASRSREDLSGRKLHLA